MIAARCLKCHRPLKAATPSGFGPVCEKRLRPVPQPDRDLFGFDVDAATAGARERVSQHVASLSVNAHLAVRRAFRQARARA